MEQQNAGSQMLGRALIARMLRCEHERMLDLLVELSYLLGTQDMALARKHISTFVELSGPHLRWEEESLCPALLSIVGNESTEQFLCNHDQFIACVRMLDELGRGDERRGDEAVGKARQLVHLLVRQICACDRWFGCAGELLNKDAAKTILAEHGQVLQENINLLHWSEWMRSRPVPPASQFST